MGIRPLVVPTIAILLVCCRHRFEPLDVAPDADPTMTADAAPDYCELDSDRDGDGHEAAMCGGLDCDDGRPNHLFGDWQHCGTCNNPCGVREVCAVDTCVSARRVFITSTEYAGDFGGASQADILCQSHADSASLDGTWMAFVRDGSTPITRLEASTAPYHRLDGIRIADDWADLMDESIQAKLNVEETRGIYEGKVWTGFRNVSGDGMGSNCLDWTFNQPGGPYGGAGQSGQVDSRWDGHYIFGCQNEYRLYCIEQ